MAWHDWNGDGKKDYLDDMIEYGGYKHFTSSEDNTTNQKHSNNSPVVTGAHVSTIGTILIVVIGALSSGFICKALDIDSGFILVILWVVISLMIFGVYSYLKQELN